MSRSLTYICPFLLVVLLVASCSSPRKARAKDCDKAAKHMAKAAWLCPDALRSTDQEVEIPGDSAALPEPTYGEVDADSLMEACTQYIALLQRERDQLAHQLMRLPGEGHAAPTPAAAKAVAAVRKVACKYEPWNYDHELFTATAGGGDTPAIQVVLKPRKAMVPCPPQVVMEQVTQLGVASWYRTAFWVLATLILLALGYTIHRTARNSAWYQEIR